MNKSTGQFWNKTFTHEITQSESALNSVYKHWENVFRSGPESANRDINVARERSVITRCWQMKFWDRTQVYMDFNLSGFVSDLLSVWRMRLGKTLKTPLVSVSNNSIYSSST